MPRQHNKKKTGSLQPQVIALGLMGAGLLVLGVLAIFLLPKSGAANQPADQLSSVPVAVDFGAPQFDLEDLQGNTVSLADYRGQVVLVNNWATWCPPCVEEIPTLERVYRSFLGKDFELLAVNVDEGGAEAVTSFMQRNRLTLPVLLNPGGSVAKSYGTFKLPETYILDRNGIVRYKVIGPANWSVPENLKAIGNMIDQQ